MAKPTNADLTTSLAEATASLAQMTERAEAAEAALAESVDASDGEPQEYTLPEMDGNPAGVTTDAEFAVRAWREQAEAKGDGTLWKLPGGETATEDPHEAVAAWRDALTQAGETFSSDVDMYREDVAKKDSVIAGLRETSDAMNTEIEDLKKAGMSPEVAADLEKSRADLIVAKKRVASLTSQLGELRLIAGHLNALTVDEVRAIMKKDTAAKFMVAADYEFMSRRMDRGRVLQGRHYPQITEYIQDGLKLIQAE
jgi:hypothetical protein